MTTPYCPHCTRGWTDPASIAAHNALVAATGERSYRVK